MDCATFNTEELRAHVERLIELAHIERASLGTVNWGDLSVVDIARWLSMFRSEDGPFYIVLVEKADPSSALVGWLNGHLDKEKFPRVSIECAW